jgi:phosphoribosyl-AMP cyclohydrolase
VIDISEIQFNKGLVPAIMQDYESGKVLMLAYMSEESFKKTMSTGTTWFFSRSRNTLWNKGETSGHFQHVKSITIDCDGDTILIKVDQIGVACHTGNESCFFTEVWKTKV